MISASAQNMYVSFSIFDCVKQRLILQKFLEIVRYALGFVVLG